ncbi:MAG TPA: hypothetical protein VHY35_21895 [Stellaceae bacterium]|nr:hypothetical protein [Stellaceae bacterium]
MLQETRPQTSRRRLLAGGLAVVTGLVGGAPPSRAQVKATKEEALYQPGPKDGQSCAVCALFRPPHACEVVQGDIAPQAWCRFFDLPD